LPTVRRVSLENASASRGHEREKAPQKHLTDEQHKETKEQGRTTQPIAPIAGRSELQEREAESSQNNRYAQIRQCYSDAKRWAHIVGKDFRRNLYHARFSLEVLGFLVLSFYAWQAYRQKVEMAISVNQQIVANKLAHDNAATQLRAYVVFGNPDGVLADFGNEVSPNKRMIKLHFYNAGETTARHFSVIVTTNINQQPHSWQYSDSWHRFRYRNPAGDIKSSFRSDELDLAAKSGMVSYYTDDKSLLDDAALKKGREFFVSGEMEYCDSFGAYHCQAFGAVYMRSIDAFVPSLSPSCITHPAVIPKGYTEIQPCEQPDEIEYRVSNYPTTTPSLTPK
jgi:hypothetical protein